VDSHGANQIVEMGNDEKIGDDNDDAETEMGRSSAVPSIPVVSASNSNRFGVVSGNSDAGNVVSENKATVVDLVSDSDGEKDNVTSTASKKQKTAYTGTLLSSNLSASASSSSTAFNRVDVDSDVEYVDTTSTASKKQKSSSSPMDDSNVEYVDTISTAFKKQKTAYDRMGLSGLFSPSGRLHRWTAYKFQLEPGRVKTLIYTAQQRQQLINQRAESSPTEQERTFAESILNKFDWEITKQEEDKLVRPVKFSIDMTQFKLRCLKPLKYSTDMWNSDLLINDEVVNFYMAMLQEQNDALCDANPSLRRCQFFTSHFIAKLLEDQKKKGNHGDFEYTRVMRWAKTINIFDLDKIFFPINFHESHWALLVADMPERVISYYCSTNLDGVKYCRHIMEWIKMEYFNQKKEHFSGSDFILQNTRSPEQTTKYDCAAFVLKTADCLANNLPLYYGQNDISRLNLATDIIRGTFSYSNRVSDTIL